MRLDRPIALSGRWVRLIPLAPEHAGALAIVAREPAIWRYLPYGPATTSESMGTLIDTLLQRQSERTDLAFTVARASDGAPVGMTRFLEIDRPRRCVEIGGTWYGAGYRRTPFNTESKYLLLRHAFDSEGALRVQFKTDLRNLDSQRAIERLGASREGVLRDHMVMPDGYLRSSVLYCIVARDWPSVRGRLEARLARPWADPSMIREPGSAADASPGTP